MNTTATKKQNPPAVAAGDNPKFAKAKAIAARLGVCPKTIFRLADKGLIHRHKINSRVVLFDQAEVDALVRSARV